MKIIFKIQKNLNFDWWMLPKKDGNKWIVYYLFINLKKKKKELLKYKYILVIIYNICAYKYFSYYYIIFTIYIFFL